MQKVFNEGRRPIKIKLDDIDFIVFHFPNEGDREFYHIPKREWINDKTNRQDREDNWHNHMMDKAWFTPSMKDFIDKNV